MPIDPQLADAFRAFDKGKTTRRELVQLAAETAAKIAKAAEDVEAARQDIARLSGVSKKMQSASYEVDGKTYEVTWRGRGRIDVERVEVQR